MNHDGNMLATFA